MNQKIISQTSIMVFLKNKYLEKKKLNFNIK